MAFINVASPPPPHAVTAVLVLQPLAWSPFPGKHIFVLLVPFVSFMGPGVQGGWPALFAWGSLLLHTGLLCPGNSFGPRQVRLGSHSIFLPVFQNMNSNRSWKKWIPMLTDDLEGPKTPVEDAAADALGTAALDWEVEPEDMGNRCPHGKALTDEELLLRMSKESGFSGWKLLLVKMLWDRWNDHKRFWMFHKFWW